MESELECKESYGTENSSQNIKVNRGQNSGTLSIHISGNKIRKSGKQKQKTKFRKTQEKSKSGNGIQEVLGRKTFDKINPAKVAYAEMFILFRYGSHL